MEFDVVAFGGGFAGLIAANRAAQLGLKAAVLERDTADRYMCNSRVTTGVSHILFQSMRLSKEELKPIIEKWTKGCAKPELVEIFAGTSARAIEWLGSEGGKWVEIMAPTGKSMILAPPRRFQKGLDWEGRGADLLLRTLEANLIKRGGQFLRGTTVEALAMENGACVGVDVIRDGKKERITAKAVVVADGGFSSSREMIAKYITKNSDKLLLRGTASSTGGGIEMAGAVGAELTGFGLFYGHPAHRDALTKDNKDLWPFPMLDPMIASAVIVGADGKRVCDEGKGGIVTANDIAQLPDPLSTTAIWDDKIWKGIGADGPTSANPLINSTGAEVWQANTLEELAAKANLPVEALKATIAEYNAALAKGAAASLTPTRTMAPLPAQPIATAPFYAIPLAAGITATMGGIAIDTECHALKPDGSVIPGLFAAGSTLSGIEGGSEVAYMGGLSKAFIFGLLAGEGVARAAGKKVDIAAK